MSTPSKRILFVDDDDQLLEILGRQARAHGLEVVTARNALTALDIVDRQAIDLVCLDVDMPTGNGLNLGQMVAQSAPSKQLPIVVLTGMSDEATRRRCSELGAHYVAKGSDTWPRLRALIQELLELPLEAGGDLNGGSQAIAEMVFAALGASESFLDEIESPAEGRMETAETTETFSDSPNRQPTSDSPAAEEGPWVLCVEDDRDFSLALKLRLQQHGISVVRAFEGVEGIQAAFTRPAEAVILDYNLPNGRGDYVLRRLKANALTYDIPVIVVSGQKRPGLEKEMLHLGAVRFFAKPVRFDELLEELKRRIIVAEPF